jgi:large subunit ribosomal protein L18
VRGSSECPRVAVFRSLNNISGQAVDDNNGITICSITTTSKQVRERIEGKTSNVEAAEKAGKMLGEKMKAVGIEQAVFDRGGFLYHGRVKAFAEGIREAGVKI